ncbi:MAG: class I SAM-dependent methyltransferase [Bacteroidota bacterium]
MRSYLRELFFRNWYWYISKIDRKSEVLLMNFGYHDPNHPIELSEDDNKDRFSTQLYHQLVSRVDVSGKSICEIGSGRGGGLAYVHKRFKPASSVGIDLNRRAVNFCNSYYRLPGMRFLQGNAHAIPLEKETLDFVLNVESSHRYDHFNVFLSQVYRVLKKEGYLLLTDFRYAYDMEAMKSDIDASGLEILHYEEINYQVINALKADDARRKDLVKRLIPGVLRKTAKSFAGAVGSETYNMFADGRYVYFVYILRKV